MTLTIGTGPFGDQGEKTFNFEVRAPRDHVLFFEDSPRRVRVIAQASWAHTKGCSEALRSKSCTYLLTWCCTRAKCSTFL